MEKLLHARNWLLYAIISSVPYFKKEEDGQFIPSQNSSEGRARFERRAFDRNVLLLSILRRLPLHRGVTLPWHRDQLMKANSVIPTVLISLTFESPFVKSLNKYSLSFYPVCKECMHEWDSIAFYPQGTHSSVEGEKQWIDFWSRDPVYAFPDDGKYDRSAEGSPWVIEPLPHTPWVCARWAFSPIPHRFYKIHDMPPKYPLSIS